MKTLVKFLFCMAFISLLFSCEKPDTFGDELSGVDLKSASKGAVIIVEPNGLDDTDNLKQAFADAALAGPGTTVQLTEGEYKIGFIEIREFCGSFVGAGKGKTVITSLNELDISGLISQNLNTFLIKFVGGDVLLSDMTIQTPEGILTTNPNEWWIEGLVNFAARNRQYTSEKDYIKAVINNVEFIARPEPVSGWRSNCNLGLMAGFDSRFKKIPGGWPLSPTDVTITNCLFDNFDIYGVLIAYTDGGKFIAGLKNCGNIFINSSTAAYGYGGSLSFWHNTNAEISAISNNFTDPPGARFGIEATSSPWPAYLMQPPQTKATIINAEDNEFNITGGTGGFLVNDQRRVLYTDAIPMLIQVKNNSFNMSNGAFTGIGCFSTAGMLIRNNKFTGSGSYGVRIMRTAPVFNENGLMLGNNFSNSAYSIATVLLNPGSRNWSIVGGNLGELITNLGENNIITGMNVNDSEVPFGQTIVDNLEDMREATNSLKKQ